jgi:hypothetical protein
LYGKAYKNDPPSADSFLVAKKYFAQGHEISFLQIHSWVYNNLATMGSKCRETFLHELTTQLSGRDVPSKLKVSWNQIIRSLE